MKENLLKDEVDGPAYAFRAERNTSSEKKHALTGLLFSYFAHGLPYACSWASHGPLIGCSMRAHLLLCTEGVEELHQAQPVGHLRHRHGHCRALQLRHLPGTHQRIYQLHDDGDLDSSHHHLRPRGLLRDGKGNLNTNFHELS